MSNETEIRRAASPVEVGGGPFPPRKRAYLTVAALPTEHSELIRRAGKLLDCLTIGTMTPSEFHREHHYLKEGGPRCESCKLRTATIQVDTYNVCGSCVQAGRVYV